MVKFYSLTSLWSWWTSLRDVLTYAARILEHFSNLTYHVFLFFHFGSLHRPQDVLASHLGIFSQSVSLTQYVVLSVRPSVRSS